MKGVALYFGLLVFTIWIVQLLLIVAAIPVWFAILFTGRYPRVAGATDGRAGGVGGRG